MSEVTKESVRDALTNVKSPDMQGNIVSQGLISEIFISAGKVIFSINVPANQAENLEPLRQAAEKVVSELPGVEKAIVALTAEKKAGSPSGQSAASSRPPAGTAPAGGPASAPGGPQGNQPTKKAGVPGIESIIAVASGKGGVGKSTTSVNLALALQKLGKKVGILDADIYGPSMPRMLGISGRPKATGRVLTPLEGYGLKVMSMGFLVEEETPMIWRGPMVISALTQMLREVEWGELDVLVVDMPPGTGDAQLTMAQQVPLAGAVIVSTPQDIALIDARKGLNMFRKVEVPILGIIENMSTFICPKCGERSDIFGHGGAEQEADKLEVPFLGGVPLHIDIRVNSDEGRPIVVSEPESQHALTYADIGRLVIDRLELEKALSGAGGPSIIFE